MARIPWLADVLREAGCQVIELDGWQGRGSPTFSVLGVIAHHTVTGPQRPDVSVAGLLRDGRPDLKGPLAQLGLDRQGRYWVIADGRASHNGYGTWGNQSVGIEAFNAGTGEQWPLAQQVAWHKGTAAILRKVGLGPDRVLGHKESDPNRKIDPYGIDMGDFRNRVKEHFYQDEDDMYSDADRKRDNESYWRVVDVQAQVTELTRVLVEKPNVALRVDRVDQHVAALHALVEQLHPPAPDA